MKKVLSITLILQFLIPSVGVPVFEHHCRGMEQTSHSLLPPESCCCDYQSKDCQDCCETAVEFKQLEENYQPPSNNFKIDRLVSQFLIFQPIQVEIQPQDLFSPFTLGEPPPLITQEVQSLLQVFLE